MLEDDRLQKEGLCLESTVIGHVEFVCVSQFHGYEFNKNGKPLPLVDGRGSPSKWRRHYFVRRYPYGDH